MTSKWDLQPRFREKKRPKVEPKPVGELCRVLPPRIARIPSILEYLFSKQDKVKFEVHHLTMAYRKRCADLADLLSAEKLS